jgi:hypothetical protein
MQLTKENPRSKMVMDKVLSQNPFLLLGIYKKAEIPGSVETVNFQHSLENNTFHVATLTGMA